MNSKIQNDLKELVAQQVISQESALKIEAYYQSKKVDAPNRLFTVFGVLGALLVGLGIILILAHNWDNFSRGTKTFLAFLPLIIGQVAVGISILKKKSKVWKETSGTFLFFAVGASMSLISQIYNIPGDFSSFLLIWMFLCAPLIYLLKSNALAILHIVFMTYYAVDYGYSYMSYGKTPWYYVLLLVSVLPHYYLLIKRHLHANITSIFNWLFPLSVTIVLGTFTDDIDEFGFLMYVILFGLFYNIGKLPLFHQQKLRRNGYLIMGSLGTVFMLIMTSFDWLWVDISKTTFPMDSQGLYVSLVLLILTIGVLGYAVLKKGTTKFSLTHFSFAIFTLIFFSGFENEYIPQTLVNLLILGIALATIKRGADTFHFGVLNYGLLIIAILIVCRFFDTEMSFVLRGILFLGFGLGFFLTNYVMLKRQKEQKMNLKN
ncbi:DUF2157 domain-containing protein [Hyunsoonleella sp. SJ7]|uniref:DUF2157 domain-containing protein n=1 Tax=Hyunsoonleella aquatilis TaxID=2762758 RepID=A0A923HD24_9FLAO|nr:DUF2157 domain-containing protein [Hyunsoonleella aquatilis]MBC3757873.1 DUF2157 domain-containing protein [Hyunsoonleella aquatilis]